MKHQHNFETLCRAIQNRDAALLECVEASTGNKIAIVCAVNSSQTGPPELVPIARMLDEPIHQLILTVRPEDLRWTPEQN